MLFQSGQSAAGQEGYLRAWSHYRALAAAEPGNAQYRKETGDVVWQLYAALEKKGAAAEAASARKRWLGQLEEFATGASATDVDRARYAKARDAAGSAAAQ